MGHKIMILEDDEAILSILTRKLTSQLFEVDSTPEIENAKKLLEKTAYSVAIVDLGLSHLDHTGGLDMVKYIRERYPGTRILVYTGNDNPDVRDLATQYGADRFMVKPVQLDELSMTVMSLCGEA